MLKRGLYEQVINKSLDRELERSDDIVASTGKLDGAVYVPRACGFPVRIGLKADEYYMAVARADSREVS